MPTEFDTEPELRRVGMYIGTVVTNDDPDNLGRVRVSIQAVIDESCWAFPMGGPGGGTNNLGFYDVPPKGADVAVWFHKGDIDVPFYMPAHWGATDEAGCETPDAACGLAKGDKHKVKTYETARYQMVWDERSGAEFFKILDKVSGDLVSMDPTNGIKLESPTKVVVDAPKIYLGGDNLDENPITGEGVALASTLDTFSKTTAGQRGQASTVVFAKKI
jgi:hypothetical protein